MYATPSQRQAFKYTSWWKCGAHFQICWDPIGWPSMLSSFYGPLTLWGTIIDYKLKDIIFRDYYYSTFNLLKNAWQNIHTTKFTFLTIFKGGIKCIHSHWCATMTTIHPQNSASCKIETLYPWNTGSSFPPAPHFLATAILLSVSVNLRHSTCLTGVESHSICLWLAYFTENNVHKVHPCCSICQNVLHS